jgi:hypothetical protein
MELRAFEFYLAREQGIGIGLLKSVHAALLAELPRTCILDFWRRHPLTLFKDPLPLKVFLRHLWEGRRTVPAAYFWCVLADLETYLEGIGQSPEGIFRLFNQGRDGGPPLDPRLVLSSLPDAQAGPEPVDLRERLLAGLPAIVKSLLPGCRMERIPQAVPLASGNPGRRMEAFLFMPMERERRLPAPDFRLFPGLMLRALPRLFGCPPFDAPEVAADMRGPAALLKDVPETDWNWKGNIFRQGKRRLGHLAELGEIIDGTTEAPGLWKTLAGYLSYPVLRMERDYRPPGMRAPRLRAGCAYGSPVTLVRIGCGASGRWRRMASLLRLRPHEPPPPGAALAMAEALHRELLDSLP